MNYFIALLIGFLPLLILGGLVLITLQVMSKSKNVNQSKSSTKNNNVTIWPYEAKKAVLSYEEISFFNVLKQTLPTYAVVATKINLKDCFFVKGQSGGNFKFYYKRLVYHNVDFVLLDNNTFRPICGILLHTTGLKDIKKDEQVKDLKSLFASVEVPLYVIEPQNYYSIADLKSLFSGYYQNDLTQDDINEAEKSIICPKCGAPMIKRTAKVGENAGKSFYGCTSFPSCKGIVNVY